MTVLSPRPLAISCTLFLIAGPALAASLDTNKPKVTVDVPTVKAPAPTVKSSEPKVKLNEDTMKAITDPTPATSKPPQKQQVKPEHVPESVKQPESDSTAPGIKTPKAPTAASIPEPRTPGLDQNQLRQMQDMAAAAAALERMEQIRPGGEAGGLPGRQSVDPDTGSAFESTGIQGGDLNETLQKADELIRDLMLGRAGPFDADPSTYIGADRDGGANLNHGVGTATGRTGFSGDPGLAAQDKGGSNASTNTRTTNTGDQGSNMPGTRTTETSTGSSTTWTSQTQNENGTTRTSQTTENADGSFTTVRVTRDQNKNITSWEVAVTDSDGNRTSRGQTILTGPDGTTVFTARNGVTQTSVRYRPDGGQDRVIDYTGGRARQDAPDDNAIGNGGNCVGVSNYGCGPGSSDPMDKITQPVHGDEVANLRGTGGSPNAGPASVTNPGNHDGSSGTDGGGSGGKPGEGAVDPEEIMPGGPVPVPGAGAASGGAVSDFGIDAALGELEALGAE